MGGRGRRRYGEGGRRRRTQRARARTRAHLFTSIDREGWGSMAERPWIRLPKWKGRSGVAAAASASAAVTAKRVVSRWGQA